MTPPDAPRQPAPPASGLFAARRPDDPGKWVKVRLTTPQWKALRRRAYSDRSISLQEAGVEALVLWAGGEL